MPEYERTRPRSAAERVYRGLLVLYPRDFRAQYGDAMVEFFHDRIAQARRGNGIDGGVMALWRALIDLVRQAPAVRIEETRRALAMRRQRNTPRNRRSRREDWMINSILQDIRYAIRGMLRAPTFTGTVLATLALGIGANVAIFSVVYGVLLRPLPYENPASIVQLEHRAPHTTVSEPEFVDYRRDARTLSALAAYRTATATLTGSEGEAERVSAVLVSEDFFRILAMRPWLGRTFTPEEDKRGGPDVVLLSHGLWSRRYGADSSLVGRTIVVNGRPRTVAAVLSPRFAFPSTETALWVPLRLNYDTLWTRNNHYLSVIGRLAPGSSARQAAADVAGLALRFTRDFPDTYSPDRPLMATIRPLSESIVDRASPYLKALFAAVAFVLLIACVNVANLLMVRGQGRLRELAIRTAMGASHTRIVRQAMTESLLHALGGGLLGVAVAAAGVRLLQRFGPSDLPRLHEIALDWRVLSFAAAVSVATGIVFGLLPALSSARPGAGEVLREGSRSGATHGPRHRRVREALVAAEIALAVVALSGAGLMLRSLWNLQSIDLGLRQDDVLTARIAPPAQTYVNERATVFWDQLTSRVRALPGVASAAAVEDLPVADGHSIWSILVNGAPMTSVANAPSAMPQKVTPGYFETMGIDVVEGRVFTDADRVGAPLVVVVNETMAKEHWPNASALGGTVKMLNDQAPWAAVIGVVRDVKSSGALAEVPPTMYFPAAQAGISANYVPSLMSLVVRTTGDDVAVAGGIRSIVRDVEPDAPVSRLETMERLLAQSLASRRFTTRLIAGFAGLALLLAGIGIYGVTSYTVTRRTAEIGIRMALGADRRRVVAAIIGDGARMAGVGAVVGTLAALATTRILRSMLVGVGPADPATLVAVLAVIAGVVAGASWVPARRASTVDPVKALRAD